MRTTSYMSIAKTKPSRTRKPRARGAFALGTLSVIAFGEAGCIRDTDCGICDPDNLILESISGVNYASKKIHVLGPTCKGDNCPGTIEKGSYFVEDIGPCEQSEEALASPRGPEEYCRISPLVVTFGIEFVFNNLLEATTIELVRKRPDQPKLFEVYDWKTDIIDIVGPTTRYNGDFTKGGAEEPDTIQRLINLSCIDNLADEGVPFNSDSYADPNTNPCNTTRSDDGDLWPVKMRRGTDDAKLQSFRGLWTASVSGGASGSGCDTPQEGYDSCCSECDHLLSTKVAKYGVDDSGNPRTPSSAFTCDATLGDELSACLDFIVSADRDGEEFNYKYFWSCPPGEDGCEAEEFKLPWYDKLRETHPDARPAHLEKLISACNTTSDCQGDDSVHRLDGTNCIGQTAEGVTCEASADNPDCLDGFCRATWMVDCRANADTTGGDIGYCVDRRFSDAGAGACFFVDDVEFEGQCDDMGESCKDYNNNDRGQTQLAACNSEANDTVLTAAECCQESLGADANGAACDPVFQDESGDIIKPVARYGRNDNLPEATRDCICTDNEQGDECTAIVDASCRDADGDIRADRAGEYAMMFVERRGGVVYDPAIKGVEWRPADLGGVPRADIESCAEGRGLIGERNRHEGWRENDSFFPESFEDFDRAMCSGAEYTVTFGVPGDREFILDKVGNSLEGKNEYTFETPEFHVIPGSGFPTDNLRIGACDDFGMRFSNKYDMSPENLQKLQLVRVDIGDPEDPDDDEITTPNPQCEEVGAPVAGGPGCAESKAARDGDGDGQPDPCSAPCLVVDIGDQFSGGLNVEIDSAVFGSVLDVQSTYRLLAPGLDERSQMADSGDYKAAFWDACGMPLIIGGADEPDYLYQFTIDEPKCKEDPDQDEIQLSCDNAPDFFNPDQLDTDGDGVGDVVDLCPTVKSAAANSADSDKDGIGNECDVCRQTTNQYNDADGVTLDPSLLTRNNPQQTDTDEDGIGDVCDNCVVTANCESYGAGNEFEVGDPIAYDDPNKCQRDDAPINLVGDACDGEMIDGAAGPVGFAPTDDFDQDGLNNMLDLCPRQPVALITCETDDECGDGSSCDGDGVCNHLDTDGDRVGDICDTCPFAPNENQVTDGGMQEDDDDGDFVGEVCETNADCAIRADAKPFGFFEVSVNGLCCTAQLEVDPTTGGLLNAVTGKPLRDPDGLPVRLDCDEGDDPDARTCRRLPEALAVAPGILTPPPGCEDALAAAGFTADTNPRLGAADTASLDALWNKVCLLPQFDQDYDGYGDPCDLCPFDFDPENTEFVDANGRVWPNDGAFCNGEYNVENKCAAQDTGDSSGSGSSGGTGDTGTGTGESTG